MKTIIISILVPFLIISIFFIIMALIWRSGKFTPFKKLFHDTLGWSVPKDNVYDFDGINLIANCKICGRKICEDSQGNWFHL